MTSPFEKGEMKPVVLMHYPELSIDPPEAASEVLLQEEPSTEEQLCAAIKERDSVWERRLAEESRLLLEQERSSCEVRLRDAIETERSAVTVACASFSKARERYFSEVEGEVVKLSLAIAGRILQREARIDPLVLLGVVRVALGKLSDPAGAVLHVPADELDLWRKATRSSGLAVEADSSLAQGELQLRTQGGIAELGLEAQLVEVERGFVDLLSKRPA